MDAGRNDHEVHEVCGVWDANAIENNDSALEDHRYLCDCVTMQVLCQWATGDILRPTAMYSQITVRPELESVDLSGPPTHVTNQRENPSFFASGAAHDGTIVSNGIAQEI